jgi:peptidoglycan/xylan/chitin deacetylase (PgdA/CDA1 family)
VSALATGKRAARRIGLRRSSLAAARMACERHALARKYRVPPTDPQGRSPSLQGRGQGLGPRPRILCYHSVGTSAWGVNDVAPERFRRQIESLLARGCRFRPAEDVARDGQPGDVAITFDDGLASVAAHAAPLLRAHCIPYTLFVVTDWADGRHGFGDGVLLNWRMLERLAGQGATIASHSATHADFGRISRDEAREELRRSRETLRSRLGIDSDSFAIPLGCRRNWSLVAGDEARAAGYTTIYAQGEVRRSVGTVGRTFITRFDNDRLFAAAIGGAFDSWEEWL